jgi:hypothetical protein
MKMKSDVSGGSRSQGLLCMQGFGDDDHVFRPYEWVFVS